MPNGVIEEVDKLFFKFIWPSGKHHVKKYVLIQGIPDGGLKMSDIKTMIIAIKMNWIRRLLNENSIVASIAEIVTGVRDLQYFLPEG